MDAQLQRAVQVMRFVDHQVRYDDQQQHLLLCGLQGSSCYERELFYQQASYGQHRRENNAADELAMRPLNTVFQLPSEFDLLQRAALPLFMQMAMRKQQLALDEVLALIDLDEDSVLQIKEILLALFRLRLKADSHELRLWLHAAGATGRTEITPQEFAHFMRLGNLPAQMVAGDMAWVPLVYLKDTTAAAASLAHRGERGMNAERKRQEDPLAYDQLQLATLGGDDLEEQLKTMERETHKQLLERQRQLQEEQSLLLRKFEDDEERTQARPARKLRPGLCGARS